MEYFDKFWQAASLIAVWLWAQWQTQALVYTILASVVVAAAATIRTGQFYLAKLPEFLWRKILPLVMVYAVFSLVGDAIQFGWLATVVWALLEAELAGSILDNLKQLGIERIPAALTKERASLL
jgi:hypothetical protein